MSTPPAPEVPGPAASRPAASRPAASPSAAPAPAPAPKPKPLPLPAQPSADAANYEETQVHQVYEAIAPHFARTRFKPWPLIERFLAGLPAGALGLDAGAGNGKYIPAAARAGAWVVAADRSQGLLEIAVHQLPQRAECVRADLCDVPWRAGLFDFAISVAAIHHLSTPERRAEAVRALLRALRTAEPAAPPARFFIYVWAYEQGPNSRRKMGSLADRRAGATGDASAGAAPDAVAGGAVEAGVGSAGTTAPPSKVQDVLVPWVLAAPKGAPRTDEQVFHRYYHLFVAGELRALVERAASADGYHLRRAEGTKRGGDGDGGGGGSGAGDVGGAGAGKARRGAERACEGADQSDAGDEGDEGDAGQRVPGAKWLRVVAEGWEADNWWIEGEVGRW